MAYFVFLNVSLAIVFFNKNKITSEYFSFFLLLFFTSFSYRNGWDIIGYEKWFIYIHENGFDGLLSIQENENIETGYLLFNYITSLLSSHFEIFIFIFGVSTCCLYYFGCKNNKLNFSIFMVIFFCSSYTRLELSTLRQGMAVAIFFYSLCFLLNKNFYKYTLFCIFAVLFHRSAVLLFFMYPLLTARYKSSTLIIVSISGFLMLFFTAAESPVNIIYKLLSVIPDAGFLGIIKYKFRFYLSLYNNPLTPQRIILIVAFIFFCYYRINSILYNLALNLMFFQVIFNTIFSFLPNLFLIRLEYYFMLGWISLVSIWYIRLRSIDRCNSLCASVLFFVFLNVKLMMLFKFESERMVYFPYKNSFLFHLSGEPETVKSIDNVEKAADMRANGL